MNHQQLDEYMRSLKSREGLLPQSAVSGTPLSVTADSLFSAEQAKTSIALSPHLRRAPVGSHDHDFYELMYVYSGSITHDFSGRQQVLHASDLLLIAPGVYHSILPCGQDDQAVNLVIPRDYFTPERLSSISRLSELSHFLCSGEADPGYLAWTGAANEQIDLYAQELICELLQPDRYTAKNIDFLLALLFSALERTSPRGYQVLTKKQMNIFGDVDHIIAYIEQNYADVSLSSLAKRFGYSENYISKAIKEKTGLSFKDFRHRQCLVQSAMLLAGTDMSVRQIADAVGMSNMSFFYNLFKGSYGMTPAEYRQQALDMDKGL